MDPKKDFPGPWWKSPYFIYIVLNLLLFGGLLTMGAIAWTQGWIPHS